MTTTASSPGTRPEPLRRDLTRPTVPSAAAQRRMAEETAARRATAAPATVLPEDRGTDPARRSRLEARVDALTGEFVGLLHDLHEHPEEHHATAVVVDLLAAHGVETTTGTFGMDTAARAVIGSTEPGTTAIAVLAEYDALPGIGHAYGHKVMCASSVGAFLALAELEREVPGSLPGRVILQTTPAEENGTAKERLAQAGMLDGVDAAVQTYLYGRDAVDQTWLGVRRVNAVFHCVPAYAASQPFMGRNALDAVALALAGVGLLRQHILPMDRIHAVVVDGGAVANIVPERAELTLMVRSKHPETPRDLYGRVVELFTGAALMTGTGVEIIPRDVTGEMPVRSNGPLLTSWTRSQRVRGRDPLLAGVIPETIAAGTGFGNVSQRVPGIHPLVSVSDADVALHMREMAAAAGSPAADAAAVDGAFGLVSVVPDWLHDERLREEVQADFEVSGGVVDVAGFGED